MTEINSVQNTRIKEWAKLLQKKYRDKTGLFIVEEEHLIQEAIAADCIDVILCLREKSASFIGQPVIIASKEVLDKLSSNVSGCTCLAICRKKRIRRDSDRIVILDRVQDPGNVGTILRTALSFGYDRVILSKDCCDIYNEKCIRSTQGALFSLDIERADLTEAIAALKADGYTIIATALESSTPLQNMRSAKKLAVIFGNEGQGICSEVLQQADYNCRIEMSGFESLNVAVASGIVMYYFRKDV